MIVASGALVALSLALLVSGVAAPATPLVYGSIAASLAAFALLGAALRRGLSVDAGPVLPAPPPAVFPSVQPVPQPAPTVIVVPGSRTFHAPTCPELQGSVGARQVDRGEALARGYASCPRCDPATAAGPPLAPGAVSASDGPHA